MQYLLAEAWTARNYDGYDHLRETVSQLGVPGASPSHALMNTAFCVSAVSVAIAGVSSSYLLRRRRRAVYLGATGAYSLGSVLVAAVHTGSDNAGIHVAGALLAIGAGNVIPVLVGTGVPECPRWYAVASTGLGLVGLAASASLIAGIGPVGLVERMAIDTFVGWEILTAVTLARSAVSRKDAGS
ncbi:DUF998 domain-containing protein [Rhodococcoides kyotonense]|uniref:DUF998 domain-containing protein n=1 Tax=Rhodococcoides kyotonense TaxID=398843 RepID=A0A239NDQ1_9NOCA|nr:DUF998 domain-containing protein [Rhodococcus kyotonensis]SNT52269.1 Protein of unknown function [Rhodococcus kyotonensis]